MGLKVVTDDKPVTVYASERVTQKGGKFTTYSIGISSKNVSGDWVNGYIDCQFKKDVKIANKSKIHIKNSFYNVTDYNGKKYLKLFISDFDVVDEGQAPQNLDSDWMNIPDNIDDTELPFN